MDWVSDHQDSLSLVSGDGVPVLTEINCCGSCRRRHYRTWTCFENIPVLYVIQIWGDRGNKIL